ncbi:MAG: enoyl-CoA hydratase-related protein [Candidatus Hodarchaeota archaeon]
MNFIETETSNNVTYIRFNRPEIHNAFNPVMIQQLTKIFEELKNRSDVRAIILTGNGRSFSAGADVNWMRSTKDFTYEQNLEDAKELEKMFNTISKCPKPVIGRVNGHAFGGGVGLISTCDVAIAVERAKFGITEVNLGIIPAVISTYILPKLGLGNAFRYFITGEHFNAQTAKEIGLINQVVPDIESLDITIMDVIANIYASSPKSIAAAKQLLQKYRTLELSAYRNYCIEEIAKIRTSEEGREGLTAFLEKRLPSWNIKPEK